MRSQLGKKILAATVSTVIALGVAEAVTRYTLGPPPRGNITPVPCDLLVSSEAIPTVRYVLRPSVRVKHTFPTDPRDYFDPGGTLTYSTNSLGFRGPETTKAKPAGVIRIVGLGDSYTFGTGVRFQDTFLSVLERHLNNQGDAVFEVLNLGVMGYNTVDEVQFLRRFGIDLEPDIVVMCLVLNDVRRARIHAFFNVAEHKTGLRSWLSHSTVLDRIAWMFERRAQTARLVEAYHQDFQPDASGWRRTKLALSNTKSVSDLQGFKLVVMVFPILWKLSDGYPFEDIHAMISSEVESLGIPVLDLLPEFAGFDGPELWVHQRDQHPNEQAHAIAGDALYRFLLEEGLIRRELSQ